VSGDSKTCRPSGTSKRTRHGLTFLIDRLSSFLAATCTVRARGAPGERAAWRHGVGRATPRRAPFCVASMALQLWPSGSSVEEDKWVEVVVSMHELPLCIALEHC
jgi:hypothetical protein